MFWYFGLFHQHISILRADLQHYLMWCCSLLDKISFNLKNYFYLCFVIDWRRLFESLQVSELYHYSMFLLWYLINHSLNRNLDVRGKRFRSHSYGCINYFWVYLLHSKWMRYEITENLSRRAEVVLLPIKSDRWTINLKTLSTWTADMVFKSHTSLIRWKPINAHQ